MIVLYTTDNYYTIILSSGSSRLTFSSVIRRTKVNIKYNVQSKVRTAPRVYFGAAVTSNYGQ